MQETGKAVGFTPGPWKVGFSDGSGRGCEDWRYEGACISASNNRCVVMGGDSSGCSMGVVSPSLIGDDRWEQEMRANAHLIAAAPEMYEALKRIAELPAHPMRKKAVEIARAAITKAEGNPCAYGVPKDCVSSASSESSGTQNE